jgi:hypothetical protein
MNFAKSKLWASFREDLSGLGLKFGMASSDGNSDVSMLLCVSVGFSEMSHCAARRSRILPL